MSVAELIRKAAACQECGKEHKYRQRPGKYASWAASDGHDYRPFLDVGVVAKLRYLATGHWEDPWVPKKSLRAKVLDR